MPNRNYNNGRSRISCGACEADDGLVGTWPRERLLAMYADFVAQVELAIARGLERRPESESRTA